jgi:hypothetical protein
MSKRNDAINIAGSIRFRGKTWRIGTAALREDKIRGVVLTPKRACLPRFILVSTHLPRKGPMRREAAIHETLHVAFPKATERQVREGAKLVRKVLGVLEVQR